MKRNLFAELRQGFEELKSMREGNLPADEPIEHDADLGRVMDGEYANAEDLIAALRGHARKDDSV